MTVVTHWPACHHIVKDICICNVKHRVPLFPQILDLPLLGCQDIRAGRGGMQNKQPSSICSMFPQFSRKYILIFHHFVVTVGLIQSLNQIIGQFIDIIPLHRKTLMSERVVHSTLIWYTIMYWQLIMYIMHTDLLPSLLDQYNTFTVSTSWLNLHWGLLHSLITT
jgi:hypothetical protein